MTEIIYFLPMIAAGVLIWYVLKGGWSGVE